MSSKSKEADGITAVPDPPAPEEVEEPAAAEADVEAEEGDEPKPDAAAEQKLPAAAKNPDEFPQKDGIIIELSAVPSVSSDDPHLLCTANYWTIIRPCDATLQVIQHGV